MYIEDTLVLTIFIRVRTTCIDKCTCTGSFNTCTCIYNIHVGHVLLTFLESYAHCTNIRNTCTCTCNYMYMYVQLYMYCTRMYIVSSKYTMYMYIIHVSVALVKKYAKVIQNYYLKFMGGFDAAQMREIVMV